MQSSRVSQLQGCFKARLITAENNFLRARGYLVAGTLARTSGDALQESSASYMQQCIKAITDDPTDIVNVSCIRVLQDYLHALPPSITLPMQLQITSAISNYFSEQDLAELPDSDDLMVTIVETLRDAILLDTRICIAPGSNALALLFTIASHGARNFQLTMLVNETFQEIASTTAALGGDAYIQLCDKVLPSLTGAFDVGNLTEENALTNVSLKLFQIPVLSIFCCLSRRVFSKLHVYLEVFFI